MAGQAWDASSEHSSTSSNPPQPSIFTGSTAATGDFRDRHADSPSAESFDEALQFAAIPRWPFAGSNVSSITSTPTQHNSAFTSPIPPSQRAGPLGVQQWRNDLMLSPGLQSPDPNRPSSVSSYGSTLSFFGMHNDQPSPIGVSPLSPPARRSGGLGPPPSARRGPPSYYSHNSFVAPIQEESDSGDSRRGSRRRASGLETVYSFDEEMKGPPYEMDGRQADPLPSTSARRPDLALESVVPRPGSIVMQNPQAAQSQHRIVLPVSQHSRLRNGQSPQDDDSPMIELPAITSRSSTAASSVEDLRSMLQAHVQNASSMSTVPSRELHLAASQQTLVNHGPPVTNTFPERGGRYSPDEVEQVLGGLQNAGLLDQATADQMRQPSPDTYVGFANVRQEPEIEVRDLADSSSEASDQEAQNIPNLIMRATSMAAQVERGAPVMQQSSSYTLLNEESAYTTEKKRSSRSKGDVRISMQMLPGSSNRNSRKYKYDEKDRRPVTSKSAKSWLDFSTSRIDFRLRPPRGTAQSTYDNKGNERRCCGLPRWAFFLSLAIFLVCLIIAIVVPVAVLGVPGASSKDSDPTIGNCVPSSPCLNGGVSMLSAEGACTCVCTSGFTGSRCEVQSDTACTTAAIGSIQKASIGSQIAPLLNQATASFNIPLNGQLLLGLFAAANLTCSTENALVVFQGNGPNKRAAREEEDNVIASFLSFPWLRFTKRQNLSGRPNIATINANTAAVTTSSAAATPTTQAQAAASVTTSTSQPVADASIVSTTPLTTSTTAVQSTSIITSTPQSSTQAPATIATSTTPTSSVKLATILVPSVSPSSFTHISSLTSAAAVSTSSSIPAASNSTSAKTPLAFAQIAVLFVLQDSHDISTAVTAQQHLQTYFTGVQKSGYNVTEARNVSLETGYSIDLVGFSLKVKNGTIFGASGKT